MPKQENLVKRLYEQEHTKKFKTWKEGGNWRSQVVYISIEMSTGEVNYLDMLAELINTEPELFAGIEPSPPEGSLTEAPWSAELEAFKAYLKWMGEVGSVVPPDSWQAKPMPLWDKAKLRKEG